MFPDAEAARVYMEGKRWPDGAVCPACDEAKRITTRKGGFYRCNACKTDFTVRTRPSSSGHIPLHKWLYAMYLLVTARKGISSLQLAKQIGSRRSPRGSCFGEIFNDFRAGVKIITAVALLQRGDLADDLL